MKFVMNRDFIVVSTSGRSIRFKKGEPTYVPKDMWAEAQQYGAVPEEELPEDAAEKSAAPTDPVEREKAIFEAFEQIALTGERENFSANGMPHVKALAKILSFNVDAKERDALWVKFQQQQDTE